MPDLFFYCAPEDIEKQEQQEREDAEARKNDNQNVWMYYLILYYWDKNNEAFFGGFCGLQWG